MATSKGNIHTHDIENFNGTTPAQAWLDTFISKAAASNWDDKEKISQFRQHLGNTASTWFNAYKNEQKRQHNKLTWTATETAFLTAFYSRFSRIKATEDIHQRKKLPDETFQEYFFNKMRLCDLLESTEQPITDKERVYYLLKGLDTTFAREIFLRNPTTPKQVLDHLRRHEEFEDTFGKIPAQQTHNEATNNSNAIEASNSIDRAVENITDQMSNLSTTQRNTARAARRPTPSSTPRPAHCFYCYRRGHIKRDCRYRKQFHYKVYRDSALFSSTDPRSTETTPDEDAQ